MKLRKPLLLKNFNLFQKIVIHTSKHQNHQNPLLDLRYLPKLSLCLTKYRIQDLKFYKLQVK